MTLLQIFNLNNIIKENRELKARIQSLELKLLDSQSVINKTNAYWKAKLRTLRAQR